MKFITLAAAAQLFYVFRELMPRRRLEQVGEVGKTGCLNSGANAKRYLSS